MFSKTIQTFAELARSKAEISKSSPFSFLVSSAMAGAYVGIGIILIFGLGQAAEPSWRSLVMGTSFGIALTLVIFAGSELFTGHTMFMTIGVLNRTTTTGSLARTWAMTWVGNLVGSVLLAVVFKLGGGGAVLKQGADLIYTVAASKMSAPALQLVARAALCNWLVCLAIWTSARTTSDAAKCILIFWCLFAFIASGFEHSVANMTVLSIALLGNHPANITVAGMAYNLFWVTLGNIIGGAVFVGLGYWLANGEEAKAPRIEARPVPAE
ncbi:MAG TPA: nitrite transporter NirC [Methylovirgula sp.]|jgi:nitrite transporter NirC